MTEYAELQVTSNYSFLRGGSFPEEYIIRAKELGYRAIALTDLHTFAGIVRAHTASKEEKMPSIVGTRLEIQCPEIERHAGETEPWKLSILVYPSSVSSYASLSTLLTIGKRRTTKDGCILTLKDYLLYQNEFISILVPPHPDRYHLALHNRAASRFSEIAKLIRENARHPKETLSIALTKTFANRALAHLESTIQIANYLDLPVVATNDVHFHIPARRPLQDVLTCIRERCTIQQAGFSLLQNSDRFLKTAEEMGRIFRDLPAAIRRTVHIAEMLSGFSLDQLRYEYPDESCPDGKNPIEYLSELTWAGAKIRFPDGIPAEVRKLLIDELKLIHELRYEKYFLTCYDIVRYARSQNILCQGRGSAANSAVCYCLGITAVDPSQIKLLFARFISKERNEPPDIDIDFEHERREEVIQYIYQKYGRHRAAIAAEVITYRTRSAIRDVGKALGLSLPVVDKLAKSVHHWTDCSIRAADLKEAGLDPTDPTVLNTLSLTKEILGFPRHLSQHVGGFIISNEPLSNIVPIVNAAMPDRTTIEWDKDDIDALGIFKIDVLGLGMLTCIRKALSFVNQNRRPEHPSPIELHNIAHDDMQVFDMICRADTLGVFQIESRAQMSMLPRLKPRCFYDLVIEVAIVRPGPIQGNMVHPYLKRRNGIEEFHYPNETVKEILGKTLGVPLFQEQAMRLAIVLADFTPDEADGLRRAMAAWRRSEKIIKKFKDRIISGMMGNGYTREFAETCLHQIQGFSEYGFPESHAASFALLAYVSSWLKCYYPAEFAAALINSQPMGFYAPAQIVRDAEAHGIKVRPVDVNFSGWNCAVEEGAIRLGIRLIRGMKEEQAEMLHEVVLRHGKFKAASELWLRVTAAHPNFSLTSMNKLAGADAFTSLGLNRREALWKIHSLPAKPAALDRSRERSKRGWRKKEPHVQLPLLSLEDAMFQDYETLGLSLQAHPMQFIRKALSKRQVRTAESLKIAHGLAEKAALQVAGIAIVRQRPGTAKGVVFITLEDETGITNLLIPPHVFERHSKEIMSSSTLLASGTLDRIGDVTYVATKAVKSLDKEVLALRKAHFPNLSYSY